MATSIHCRSTEQVFEDNLCELHTRLQDWLRTLQNERTFCSADVSRKRAGLVGLKALIERTERVMLGEESACNFSVYNIKRRGIHYAFGR